MGAVTYIGDVKVRSDDDCVDRLNHNYSVFILVLLAVLVSTKQYVGEPINCWVPAQFTHNHEDYSNKVCWVSNTYYMPFQQKKLPSKCNPNKKGAPYMLFVNNLEGLQIKCGACDVNTMRKQYR